MHIENTGTLTEPHFERGGKMHNTPFSLGASRAKRRENTKAARRRIAQRRTQQARRIGRTTG